MQDGIKFLEVCNNYGSNTDGIGKYAKIIAEELKKIPGIADVEYVTGYTSDTSRVKMVFSLIMSKALWRAARMAKHDVYNVVMLEYPFQEYNPLILCFYNNLRNICRKNGTMLALSVHEYVRANRLRKMVVEYLARQADLVLVSEAETQKRLQKYNNNICLRNMIGTVFPTEKVKFEDKTDEFLYFGLVNRSKAFSEMIEAWRLFNKKKEHHLTVISSSDVSGIISTEESDIQVLKDLPDQEVEKYLRTCRYMILPVQPEVSEVNGTFKTAAIFGCVCIGHFGRCLSSLPFVVQLDDYSKKTFSGGLDKACKLDWDIRRTMFGAALEYGHQFTPEAAVQELVHDCGIFIP